MIMRVYYTRKCKGCGKTFKKVEQGIHRAKKEYCTDECQKKHALHRLPLDAAIRKYIFSRDRDQCRYCGERAECIDHVIPVAHGGSDSKSNLVACCTACNMTVMDRVFDNFSAKRKWILKARKMAIAQTRIADYKRPFWHRFVYGGFKR